MKERNVYSKTHGNKMASTNQRHTYYKMPDEKMYNEKTTAEVLKHTLMGEVVKRNKFMYLNSNTVIVLL